MIMRDEEDIERLKDIHMKTKSDFNKGWATVENDMVFHAEIYKSTHNPFVASIGNSIMEMIPTVAYDLQPGLFKDRYRKS